MGRLNEVMKTAVIHYAPPGSQFKYMKKIADYMYETEYTFLDYTAAYEYFKGDSSISLKGACSCARSGNFFGRNLDWTYDNQAEFLVRRKGSLHIHSSIGVAGGFQQLTDSFVMSKQSSYLYTILPFRMRDGINDCNVFASMNVVPLDNGENVSVPEVAKKHEICGSMLIRFILDKFSSAKEAVEYIRDYVSVYFPKSLHDKGYELHYIMGDLHHTYCLEFIENRAVIREISAVGAMTNFYLTDAVLNDDNSVYTPETQTAEYNAIDTNRITANGSGLERFNMITTSLQSASTKQGMQDLMHSLIYSRAYSTYPDVSYPFWYTEYTGVLELSCKSDPDDFARVIEYSGDLYSNRDRKDGLTWQTVHTSVYDVQNTKLYLTCQEVTDREFRFTL